MTDYGSSDKGYGKLPRKKKKKIKKMGLPVNWAGTPGVVDESAAKNLS